MDSEFYCNFKLLMFGMHCNKYLFLSLQKDLRKYISWIVQGFSIFYLHRPACILLEWLLNIRESWMTFRKTFWHLGRCFLSRCESCERYHLVWGYLRTFGLVRTSVLHVTATYYDKYCCVELGTAFTWNCPIQIDIALVLNYT